MFPQLKFLTIFYILIQYLSLLCLPFSFFIFKNSKDRGYVYSKTASLLIAGFFYYLLSITGLTRDMYVSNCLMIGILTVLFLLFYLPQADEIKKFLKSNLSFILFAEAILLSILAVATLIKMGDPHLFGNTEKFPDYMIYRRLVIDGTLPPMDLWMSGKILNYYYMGHLLFANFTRLSLVPTEYGINLSVILIFGLIFISSFSIIYNLTGRRYLSLLCAVSISFLSHLDGLLQILRRSPSMFDWWASTRVISGTINEFPFFAFLLGDLHAHYISFPILLFFIALLAERHLEAKNPPTGSDKRFVSRRCFTLFTAGITVAFMFTTNPWYMPVMGVLLLLTALGGCSPKKPWPAKILGVAAVTLAPFALGILLSLPFVFSYKAPVAGFWFVPKELSSGFGQFMTVFAFPLSFTVIYLFLTLKDIVWSRRTAVTILAVLIVSLGLFALRLNFVTWILFIILSAEAAVLIRKNFSDFVDILMFVSTSILAGCEIIFLRDNYAYEFLRMNTVFKFHWAALSILLLVTPLVFVRSKALFKGKTAKSALAVLFVLLFLSCSIYVVIGTRSRNFNPHKHEAYRPLSLDGLRFMKATYPDDYSGVKWLIANSGIDDVILEATGKPFSLYSRFSTFSGRPTVLGWANHELVWNPSNFPAVKERADAVSQIYSALEKRDVLDILKRYNVRYIMVGSIERKEFPSDSLKNFAQIARSVYKRGDMEIFELR